MPKIPKSIKKQVKSNYNKKESGIGRSRMKWSYKPGDLVKFKNSEGWGIVVETIHNGVYVWVLTSSGRQRFKSANLEKIQESYFKLEE